MRRILQALFLLASVSASSLWAFDYSGGSGGGSGTTGATGATGAAGADGTSSTQTYTVIASSTIGGAGGGTFDFTSIPSTYQELILEVYGRSTISSESDMQVSYNNDTTAGDYISRSLYHSSGGVSHLETLTRFVTYITVSSASSYQRSYVKLSIPDYAQTAYTKTGMVEGDAMDSDANVYDIRGCLLWVGPTQPAPAINRITVTITGGLFAQGSKAILTGVKKL